MEPLTLILGIASICFIMIYISFHLEPEHRLLQIFLITSVFFLFLLIPQATIDYGQSCDWLVNNYTVVDNLTTNNYVYSCHTDLQHTPNTFYTAILWILRVFVIYITVYLIYVLFKYMAESIKGK